MLYTARSAHLFFMFDAASFFPLFSVDLSCRIPSFPPSSILGRCKLSFTLCPHPFSLSGRRRVQDRFSPTAFGSGQTPQLRCSSQDFSTTTWGLKDGGHRSPPSEGLWFFLFALVAWKCRNTRCHPLFSAIAPF